MRVTGLAVGRVIAAVLQFPAAVFIFRRATSEGNDIYTALAWAIGAVGLFLLWLTWSDINDAAGST